MATHESALSLISERRPAEPGECQAAKAPDDEELERERAEAEVVKAVVGSVFSLRKPRDVVAGTSSGLKTVARGVGLGFASLVAQPIIGAKQEGAKGFVKGLGAGVTTCVGSTVAGAVVGTTQIVRGAVNTPGAMMQRARGQVWNAEERRWEVDWYSLPEEEAEVFGSGGVDAPDAGGLAGEAGGSSGSRATPSGRPSRKVVDTSLYDTLGVPPEATEAEIRKAFYKQSLAHHPDKNPDNPKATEMFQNISEAYRILGDGDRRRAYDLKGKEKASEGMAKIEPAVFFAALFGSHHFEPWIGRLKLAQDVDGDLEFLLKEVFDSDAMPEIDLLKASRAHQKMKGLERERQVRCAVLLARRLEPIVAAEREAALDRERLRTSSGGEDGEEKREAAYVEWEKGLAEEVEALKKVPCGVEMMSVIGWVYVNRSRQFFAGSVIKRAMAKVEGDVHLAHTKAKLAGSVGRTALTISGHVKKAERKAKQLEAEKAERAEKAEKAKTDGSKDDEQEEPESTAEAARASSERQEQRQSDAAPGATPEKPSTRPPEREEGGGSSGSGAVPARQAAAAGPNRADAAEEPQPSSQHDGLQPGTLVMLRGLKAAELNNEVGVVVGFDTENRRYVVQLLPDGGPKKLKQENLLVLEAPPQQGGAPSSESTRQGVEGTESTEGSTYGEGEGQWAPGGEEAEMQEVFKECMPLFHDAAWSATALDIEFTLAKVIQKVLRDMSVDRSARRARAEALLRLGNVLQAPMKELRAQRKAAAGAAVAQGSAPSDDAGAPARDADLASESTTASRRSARSVLARLKAVKPSGLFRRKPRDDAAVVRAKEAKIKRMEEAMAMMAAGASTDDVDDMLAARAELEKAHGGGPQFGF